MTPADLIARLRARTLRVGGADAGCGYDVPDKLCHEAASALTAQAERIAVLREIHASHESGRCYQCGWPLKASIEEGCVI